MAGQTERARRAAEWAATMCACGAKATHAWAGGAACRECLMGTTQAHAEREAQDQRAAHRELMYA